MAKRLFFCIILLSTCSLQAADSDLGKSWDKVKSGSKEVWQGTKEGASEVWESTKEGAKKAADSGAEMSGNIWNGIKTDSKEAYKQITE